MAKPKTLPRWCSKEIEKKKSAKKPITSGMKKFQG